MSLDFFSWNDLSPWWTGFDHHILWDFIVEIIEGGTATVFSLKHQGLPLLKWKKYIKILSDSLVMQPECCINIFSVILLSKLTLTVWFQLITFNI